VFKAAEDVADEMERALAQVEGGKSAGPQSTARDALDAEAAAAAAAALLDGGDVHGNLLGGGGEDPEAAQDGEGEAAQDGEGEAAQEGEALQDGEIAQDGEGDMAAEKLAAAADGRVADTALMAADAEGNGELVDGENNNAGDMMGGGRDAGDGNNVNQDLLNVGDVDAQPGFSLNAQGDVGNAGQDQ
jgi:hypothetical protein